jgi:hypothetical protein
MPKKRAKMNRNSRFQRPPNRTQFGMAEPFQGHVGEDFLSWLRILDEYSLGGTR